MEYKGGMTLNLIVIGILFVLAFIMQYAFTLIQMKSFKVSYRNLRRKGRVVIGKKKGAYRAGAIVMMAIDDNNFVIDTEYMQGTTIFARFKKLDCLNGYNIGEIDLELCKEKGLSNSLKNSIVDGVTNFKKIMSGEEIEMPKSPLGKLADKVKTV